MTLSTSSSERAYHHGDLRQELLRASRELIEERGPEAFTLREVARRAGVSHTAPYRHFRDRGAILDAVAAEGFAAHRDAGRRAAAEHTDAKERLRAAGRAYVQFALDNRAAFRVMFARSPENPAVAALGAESFAELLARIDEGQAAGVIGAGNRLRIAGVLWSGVHGLAELAVSGSLALVAEGDSEAMIDFALETLLRGLEGDS
ncbi:MAG: TetR/AcrR family transcriptional regulator [Myxococcales bacterium]|nr:TetR/AcrR family transcriptional regulator [Myxococcales bacterium]